MKQKQNSKVKQLTPPKVGRGPYGPGVYEKASEKGHDITFLPKRSDYKENK